MGTKLPVAVLYWYVSVVGKKGPLQRKGPGRSSGPVGWLECLALLACLAAELYVVQSAFRQCPSWRSDRLFVISCYFIE